MCGFLINESNSRYFCLLRKAPQFQPFPYSLFQCEQQITWAQQAAGLYRWKDRNVKVKCLKNDDKPSTTTTKTQSYQFLQVLESCMSFPSEYSSTFLPVRWNDLSSSTRIQINKNDFSFVSVICYILVLVLKQCCVLLTFIAICYFWCFVG